MIGPALSAHNEIASFNTLLLQSGFLSQQPFTYLTVPQPLTLLTPVTLVLQLGSASIRRVFRTRQAIVHLHTTLSELEHYLSVLAWAKTFGYRIVLHLHDSHIAPELVQKSSILSLLHASTVIIVLARRVQNALSIHVPDKRIEVIPYAVRLNIPLDHSAEEAYRVLCLSDCTASQGIVELLSAIAQLSATFPEIKLLLNAQGDLDLVAQQCQILGLKAEIELLNPATLNIEQELAKAAVFVLPTQQANLPLHLLRAMSAGKAVIATSVGNISQVIQHDYDGLIVPVQDAVALAAALGRLFDHPALQRTLGMQAHDTIAKRYSHESVLSALTTLYNTLA